MSNIGQPGSYRGLVLDRGISNSSGGHLQMSITMQATEKYDEENQVWTPFNYEDSEAQAYLNLITSKEKENAINCRQIMRAFGWDGMAFSALNDPDSKLATQIQWRMGTETYEGVERVKVQAIDAHDAAPGRKVEKLDAAAMRAMDAKYAAVLKNLGGGPKPKSARPVAPVAQPDPTATASAPVPAPTTTPTSPSDPAPKARRGRPPAPKSPDPVPVPVPAASTEPMDQGAAWGTVYSRAHEAGKTDLEINTAWSGVVKEIGVIKEVDGVKIITIEGPDWSGVAAKTAEKLGV